LATAESQGYQAVLLRLNTPGGLDSAMRQLTQAMLNAQVPIIVYVTPSGGRAASAGLFVVLAGHVAAMTPGTNIGAAHPVSIGGAEVDETMAAKVENDAAALIRSIAGRRDRNADWAEQAVRQSVSVTADEALELGVIDLVSPDQPSLLRSIDGRVVETGNGPVTLRTAEAPIVELPMNALEHVLNFLSDPNIAYILLTIGVLGILGELAHPGTLLPGTVGGLALILAFVGLGNLPFNAAGVALIILAFVLLALDLFTQGLGALTVGAVAAFVLGSVILFRPFGAVSPAAPALEVHPGLLGGTTLALFGGAGWVLRAVWRAHRSRPVTPQLVELAGRQAFALSDLTPRGQVRFEGERWLAVAEDGQIGAGDPVEIVRAEGLLLHVRAITPRTDEP
ncbi:MAG TPA: nodulation protein NfeD, partial [Dehalococcoidia bacterium]|nr:nodulation protein NfeD [Dehalococcoidia bacterium]